MRAKLLELLAISVFALFMCAAFKLLQVPKGIEFWKFFLGSAIITIGSDVYHWIKTK